jgi:hypothetical protein
MRRQEMTDFAGLQSIFAVSEQTKFALPTAFLSPSIDLIRLIILGQNALSGTFVSM